MKTRKLLVVLFAIMVAVTVSAQENGHKKGHKTPEEKAKKQTEWMKKDLQLTDAQAKQVEDINLKYAKNGEERKEALKAERKDQKAQKEAELRKVLTPEQVTKLEQKQADNKAKKEAKKTERKEKVKRCLEEQKANGNPAQ